MDRDEDALSGLPGMRGETRVETCRKLKFPGFDFGYVATMKL